MQMFKKCLLTAMIGLFLYQGQITEAHALKVNIFSLRNGIGLEIDQKIMADALTELGCDVHCKNVMEAVDEASHADVNIFFQLLNPVWFRYASANWFVPNPEWYGRDLALLDQVDLVLCRTREVERIFNDLDKNTYFLGFTSRDCYDPTISKHYDCFFHLAGASSQKGTASILQIWFNHPELPPLVAIKHNVYLDHRLKFERENLHWIPHRIETSTLCELQNTCGIHLCPSETEGFGHYIMEAMSTEAVVVTTNAPPMNEFVSDFLVPYGRTAVQDLAINYYVNQKALEHTIRTLITMPTDKLEAIGRRNRQLYLEKTQEFKQKLRELMVETIHRVNGSTK